MGGRRIGAHAPLHSKLNPTGSGLSGLALKSSPLRILLLSGLCLIGSLSESLHAYTFTGRTGTKVEAEVVSVSVATNTARLRLADGKEADVPFANVSEADQEYLRHWAPPNAGSATPAPALKTTPQPA